MKDLRQEVLNRLGVTSGELDPGEDTLVNRWNNNEGETRDRIFALVEREYWQANTKANDFFRFARKFPDNSQRLIALLCTETVAFLLVDARFAECRGLLFEYCHGRASEEALIHAQKQSWEAYRDINPTGVLQTYKHFASYATWSASWGHDFLLPGCTAHNVLSTITAWNTPVSFDKEETRKAEIKLFGPDGPLKLLVESPRCGEFPVLSSRWDVALKCAQNLFRS